MKQRVIVIGQGFTGRLSVTRSVAEIGCEVFIIALVSTPPFGKKVKKTKEVDAKSKYVSSMFYCANRDENGLLEILLSKCKVNNSDKPIIVPDNDFSAAVVDKYLQKLEPYFICPHIGHQPGKVVEWMSKIRQKSLAKEIGLRVAEDTIVTLKDRKFSIPTGINYPCFAKPLLSIFGGKSGLRKCNNEIELHQHLNCFAERFPDSQVLVEEYKNIEKEYAVLGFSNGIEVFIPGVIQILLLGHASHFGVAIQGRVMPNDGFEDLISKFKSYVLKMGFVGIFDIDFYYGDGEFFFGEMNMRFGGSGYAYTKMGCNLPAIMVKSFRGENTQELFKMVTGSATYVNERMLIDDWYFGFLATKEYHHIINTSDIHFVKDVNDPYPEKALKKLFQIRKLKKIIKSWMGRK